MSKKKSDKVMCPKCDPQKNIMIDRKDLQKHIKTEHIDWGDYSE